MLKTSLIYLASAGVALAHPGHAGAADQAHWLTQPDHAVIVLAILGLAAVAAVVSRHRE